MDILMCQPDYYAIEYEINPWMNKAKNVQKTAAVLQWQTLYQTIVEGGANVKLVNPAPHWPDMVFTANAGLIHQNKFYLSHFKHPERQGEAPFFRQWFLEAGFSLATIKEPKSHFEGAGDALFAGDHLFAGFGFRTDKKFYSDNLFIDENHLTYCELSDPFFYHIDTCFCPITSNLAIWYPPAFTVESQHKMAEKIELIPVIEDEAKRFACNAVVIDQHIILPTGCPQLTADLVKRGFQVSACVMDEFIKAGGACKCLTLRLN